MNKVDWEGGVEGFEKRIGRCGLFNRTQLASLLSFIIMFLRLSNQKEIHYLKQMRTRGRGESTRAWDWGKNMPNGKDSERAYDTSGVKQIRTIHQYSGFIALFIDLLLFPALPVPVCKQHPGHGQKGPGVLPALSIESVTSGGPESLNGGVGRRLGRYQ